MKFFAVILSLQLMVSPVLAQTAGAQNGSTDQVSQAPTGADGKPITDPKQASEVQAQKNEEYDKSSQTSGGFEFYSRQALNVINTVIGANMITRCTFGMKVPSIAMFWAASLVYIMSEISNGGKAQNKDQKDFLTELAEAKKKDQQSFKGGGNGDIQRQIIEKRLADEKRLSKLVDDRTMWLSAVTAMYTAAAILALTEEFTGNMAGVAAGATACAATAAALATPCGPGYAGCYATHLAACTAVSPLGAASTKPNFAAPMPIIIAGGICGASALYFQGCYSYLGAYSAIAWANCSPLWPQFVIMDIGLSSLVAIAYSTGFGMASGDGNFNYIKIFLGLLTFFVKALNPLIQAAYNFPIPRSITFGINGLLTAGIITGLKQRQSGVIQPNIQKLTKLLNSFRQQTDDNRGMNQYVMPGQDLTAAGATVTADANGNNAVSSAALPGNGQALDVSAGTTGGSTNGATSGATSGSSGGVNGGTNQVTPNTILALPDAAQPKTCAAQTDKGVDISEAACANPIRLTRPVIGELAPNDKALMTSTTTLATDLANELASGNTERARVLAGEVSAKMGALNELYNRKKVELNEQVRAKGDKDFDYQTEMKTQLTKMQDTLNDGLRTEKIAALPPNFRMDLSDVGASAPGLAEAETKDGAKSTDSSKAPTQEVVKLEAATPTEAGDEPMDEAAVLAAMEENAKLSEADQKAAGMNGYLELDEKLSVAGKGQDGISPVADASIFMQISNRYLRSLDRILTRKKHKDLTPPPATKKKK